MKALQKIITLEKLCRAMQNERALLHERLQELDSSVVEDMPRINETSQLDTETDVDLKVEAEEPEEAKEVENKEVVESVVASIEQ